MQKKTIIISGINMVEGGIFTILDNCLQKIAQYVDNKNINVIALVHDASRFNYKNITFIEFPKSKKRWINRLYYEYFYFKKLSKKLNPDIWFSLHDTTPNVFCKKQFVYCHNPNVFYKPSLKEWFLEPKVGIFYVLYKHLFKLNIKKNKAVFVQQHWIKNEFMKMYNISNIWVAKPEYTEKISLEKFNLDPTKVHFFYPSFPRTFKNFELIFDAIELLQPSIKNKVLFHFTTIKNNPKKFAVYLYEKYKNCNEVFFWQWIDRDDVLKLYNSVNCLVFPSKVETWGLPISEAKAYNLPMLLANLSYAKEAVGNYKNVSFFDVDNANQLAKMIEEFVAKTIVFQENTINFDTTNELNNWEVLFNFITKD